MFFDVFGGLPQEEMQIEQVVLFGVLAALLIAVPGQAIAIFPSQATNGVAPHSLAMVHANATAPTSPKVPFWNDSSAWERFSTGVGPVSSPWGDFGITYSFGAELQLSGGAIDAGTTRSGQVVLEKPAYSLLNITLASRSVSVPLPNPLGMNQPLTVWSFGLQLEIPYLGSFTLADFSLDFVASIELSGDSTMQGCGAGAGQLIWDGSISSSMTACARGLTAGSTFNSTLSDLQFAWAIGLNAVATIADINVDTITLIPMTSILPFAGSVTSLSSEYQVVSRPSHLSAQVTPNPAVDGETVSVLSNASGGAGNLTYDYNGTWPGSPCTEDGPGYLSCTASDVGNYTLEVIAVDQQGVSTAVYVNYTETAPQTPPYYDPFASLTLSSVLEGIGVVALIAIVVGGLIAYASRPSEPSSYRCYTSSDSDLEDYNTSNRDFDDEALPYASDEVTRRPKHSSHSRPRHTSSRPRSVVRRTESSQMRSYGATHSKPRRLPSRDPKTGRFVSSTSKTKSGSKSVAHKRY